MDYFIECFSQTNFADFIFNINLPGIFPIIISNKSAMIVKISYLYSYRKNFLYNKFITSFIKPLHYVGTCFEFTFKPAR